MPIMGFQILQYEFLGPIPLDEWGPPMQELVYLIMGRDGDRFRIVYAGECQKTEERGYFVQHERFKCWASKGGSALYLAIFPMFGEGEARRGDVLKRITSHYKPACNDSAPKPEPGYATRPKAQAMSCPCCGSKMEPEKSLPKSTVYRCGGCGMSDTRLNP